MENNWQLSSDYISKYLLECEQAATIDDKFKVFRDQQKCIGTIIENSAEEHKKRTYDKIYKEFTVGEFQAFETSDKVGTAAEIDLRCDDWAVTSTTMRYIYILHLIQKFFNTKRFNRIIEIGAGYGGQCKIIYDYCMVKEYLIYDLPQVQMLQKRFLSEFYIHPVFMDEIHETQSDLVIAWCSWSELGLSLREKYLSNIISKAKNFLICSNYDFDGDLKLLQSIGKPLETYKDEIVSNVIYSKP